MKTTTLSIALLLLSTAAASASDVNLKVRTSGNSTITVAPGASVPWEVIGELSDAANQGLAFVSVDMHFTGGPIAPASAPSSGPMVNFNLPNGMTNPQGFGGVSVGNDLLQVGGCQNTWNNVFAPVPTGVVVTNIGLPGAPVTIATGSLTAPVKVGTYTLSASSAANVIRTGETGSPIWRVDAAGQGTVQTLTIKVSALSANVPTLSLATAGSQILSLNGGLPNANKPYIMLGSVSGTTPGIFIALGVKLPLNYDVYFDYLLNHPNTAPMANSVGMLNSQGKATATFTLPAGLGAQYAGLVVNHAFLVPSSFASDAASLTLVP